jgi:transcriptional regulator with XRE-family HTH domain
LEVVLNGPELKIWRKTLGLTQSDAANQFGVTRPTVQNWEYGITPVPLTVELAARLLLRRWKQRPEFGPVTLAYAFCSFWHEKSGEGEIPTLCCKRCPDNQAAFQNLFQLRQDREVFDPFIMDETNYVVWSGPDLIEACENQQQ